MAQYVNPPGPVVLLRPLEGLPLYGVQKGFEDYKHLWITFEQLLPNVQRRNQYEYANIPPANPPANYVNPKIVPRLRASGRALTPEEEAYEKDQIYMWEQMEDIIKMLSESEYVKRRYPGREAQYAQLLYDLIQ